MGIDQPLGAPDEAINPTDPYLRQAQTFPRLSDDQVQRASRFGVVEAVPSGRTLFERGDRGVDFFIVLEGAVEVYERTTGCGHAAVTVHHANEFTGELDLFNDRASLVGGRMTEVGRVVRIRRAQFRRLLAAEPDIAEIVLRAFILRRVGVIMHTQAGVVLVGERRSAEALRLQRFLNRNGYPVRWQEADEDAGRATLAAHGLDASAVPAIVLPKGQVLRSPSNAELAAAIGLAETVDPEEVFDLAVVGAGPAGLAAAVYGASEGLRTVVLETEAPGGQAGTSSKIENYLGFPTGISGQALAGRAQVQAQKFGARLLLPCRVANLDCGARPYALQLDDGRRVRARAVVVATGARYRSLEVADVARFEGSGIHYAATGVEAALCEQEEVVVVGGGNSAGQAAVFLSRHAARVHVLVRGTSLAASMSDYLVGRIAASATISVHTETEIVRLAGTRYLEQVTWRHRRTGAEETRPVASVFLMLGAVPNTEWLRGCVDLDDNGFVRCGNTCTPHDDYGDRLPMALETSRPGIFAVGDVRAGSVKRVASSVGEGSIVVAAVHQVLAETADAS